MKLVEAHGRIGNYDLVVDAFGEWPAFHDAEVLRVVLDRDAFLPGGATAPRLELVIHGWRMTSELTPEGFYRLDRHHRVHILFEDVSDVRLEDFNEQNVLFFLEIEPLAEASGDGALAVTLSTSYGLSGGFCAASARVLSVEPCDEEGRPMIEGSRKGDESTG